MILKYKVILLVLMTFIFSGCVVAVPLISLGAGALGGAVAASKVKEKGPEKTQLQIRELQTRLFDTRNSKKVLKTMLNVLQDDGFIVKEANVELGLLTAAKEIDVETKGAVFWGTLFKTAWEKNATVEVTANVSEFGKQTRVRVNFQKKVYDSSGRVASVELIEDLKFYQEFFAKVDKGLFIEREKL